MAGDLYLILRTRERQTHGATHRNQHNHVGDIIEIRDEALWKERPCCPNEMRSFFVVRLTDAPEIAKESLTQSGGDFRRTFSFREQFANHSGFSHGELQRSIPTLSWRRLRLFNKITRRNAHEIELETPRDDDG